MLRGETEQEVGVDQLTLVPYPLVIIQARKGGPVGRARRRKRPCAVAVGNPTIPIELRSATLSERRHQATELGMHRTAMVALIVVLEAAAAGDKLRKRNPPHESTPTG